MIFEVANDEQSVSFTFGRDEFYVALFLLQQLGSGNSEGMNNLVALANYLDQQIQADEGNEPRFTVIKGGKKDE